MPFDMRMLHAELPQHVGRLHDSIDRLCHLRTVISQVSLLMFSTYCFTEVSLISVAGLRLLEVDSDDE